MPTGTGNANAFLRAFREELSSIPYECWFNREQGVGEDLPGILRGHARAADDNHARKQLDCRLTPQVGGVRMVGRIPHGVVFSYRQVGAKEHLMNGNAALPRQVLAPEGGDLSA